MGSERLARVSHGTDVLPSFDLIAWFDIRHQRVHVRRDDAVAVRDDDPVARTAVPTSVVRSEQYRATISRIVGRALCSCEVDTPVERVVERAIAEIAGNKR